MFYILSIIFLILYIFNIQFDVFFIPTIPILYKFFYLWSNGYTILLVFLLQFLIIVVYYRFNRIFSNILLSLICFWVYYLYDDKLLVFNPLLYSVFMTVHPVILYLSYSFMFAAFCGSFQLYLQINRFSQLDCLKCQKMIEIQQMIEVQERQLLFITKLALILNFLSICLGGAWAYHELGWGGVWFFDPVENLALLPFISILGVLHNFYSSLNRIFWSLVNIISVILSVVLVRSGLLFSVHSFAGNVHDFFIYISIAYIAFISLIICLSISSDNFKVNISWFFINVNTYCCDDKCKFKFLNNGKVEKSMRQNNSQAVEKSFFSEYLLLENILWLVCYLVVMIVVLYPIFMKIVYSKQVEISLVFFQKYFISLMFIVLFFMIDSKKFRVFLLVLLVLLFIVQKVEIYFILNNYFIDLLFLLLTYEYGYGALISITGILHSIVKLYKLCQLYMLNDLNTLLVEKQLQQRIMRGFSRYIAHLGVFVISFFLILYVNNIHEENFVISENQIIYSQVDNIVKQSLNFEYEGETYKPELLYYVFEKVLHSKIASKYFLLYDVQVVILNIDQGMVNLSVRKIYYVKYILIGVFLVLLGIISVSRRGFM